MSYWSTFIGVIQKFCEDDPEIEDLLKETDQLQRDNDMYENELEDQENENMRFQIELFNVETMIGPFNHPDTEPSVEKTNSDLMESCISIHYAISQIDFIKILQCNHMKMEQNWRKEWQQMQDYSVGILKCHDKMEQRHVTQRYRKVEMAYNEAKHNLEMNRKSMQKSLQESSTRHVRAIDKQNGLIVNLIKGAKDLENMREEYQKLQQYDEKIESLKKTKLKLMEQLEEAESKNLNSILPYKSEVIDNTSSPSKVLETSKNDVPKFPSFTEIIKSFNQDFIKSDTIPKITVIENTTNIVVKSILRNSQDNSMEINQSFTTKHTKHVQFKLQLEEEFEISDHNSSSSDSGSDDSQDTVIEVPISPKLVKVPVDPEIQAQIPIVDLLSSSDDSESEEGIYDDMDTNENNPTSEKPKIDILECVVFKPPLNNVYVSLPQEKENLPPHVVKKKDDKDSKNREKTDREIMPPPPSPAVSNTRDPLSTLFFKEFLRYSPSPNSSSGSEFGTANTITNYKDFESYLNGTRVDKSYEPMKVHNNDNCLEFLDFDTDTFNFYSNDDDNDDDGSIMDFLLS